METLKNILINKITFTVFYFIETIRQRERKDLLNVKITFCIVRISPGSSFDSFSGFSGSVIVSGSESSESELEELSETLELYSPGSLSEIPSVPGGCSKIILEEN